MGLSLNLMAQNFQSVKQIKGDNFEKGVSLLHDAKGNLYTGGLFDGIGVSDFDPGSDTFNMVPAGNADIFISKLNASGNFVWAKKMGGTGSDMLNDMAIDAESNTYSTGNFELTSDFDPGSGIYNLVSAGNTDVYISKLDSMGNLLWAKRLGGTETDYGFTIALDDSGNVYTSGYFCKTVDFDPGSGIFNLTSTGYADMFLLKLNPAGNFVWVKKVGGPTTSIYVESIYIDKAANIFATGGFRNTIDFDPGAGIYNMSSAGDGDIFVLKLNSFGNFVWAKKIGGVFHDFGKSIAIDASAKLYISGKFSSNNVDFDPGTGVHNLSLIGSSDEFILKLDTSGKFEWVKSMKGTTFSAIEEITLDKNANIYSTGRFQDSVDFDPGTGIYMQFGGDFNAFITKLDSSGNFKWARNIGGSSTDVGNALSIDAAGNLFITGTFYGLVDFDPAHGVNNLQSSGGGHDDAFILKLGNCAAFVNISPKNISAQKGTNIQFNIASASATSILQWQQNTGSGFANLSNGGQFSGVTNDTLIISNITITQNKYSYRCYAKESCADTSNSAILTVLATGIEELTGKTHFVLYPNPSNDVVTIQLNNITNDLKYIITDITGSQVLTGNLVDQTNVVDIGSLVAGFYFVQVNEIGNGVCKLVKK